MRILTLIDTRLQMQSLQHHELKFFSPGVLTSTDSLFDNWVVFKVSNLIHLQVKDVEKKR